jgi:broad specificity phosphatase PhoE
MGTIYLVRHAQAAYGTDDYDRLTPTGFAQARLLGTYFGARQIHFDAVYMGELRRHVETLQGILETYPYASEVPSPERFAGLNEYRGEALVTAFTGSPPVSGCSTARSTRRARTVSGTEAGALGLD